MDPLNLEMTNGLNRHVAGGGGRGAAEGGVHWESGVSRCKLFHKEWVNCKVPLYGSGNSIQGPVINHTGKEAREGCVCLYN